MTKETVRFPKVELHLHLDGSVPPETMWRLAEKEHVPLPAETPEAFREWLKTTSDCRSVNEYLERFELPLQLLQSRENLAIATHDLILLLAGENYAYAEIRFAPQLHVRKGLTQRDAVEAVLEGRAEALKSCPGLKIGFFKPSEPEYFEIVKGLSKRVKGLKMTDDELLAEARKWEMGGGGLSGRSAEQFIRTIEGKKV